MIAYELGEQMAQISIEDMLQAGVHFGHQTKYWNPKMFSHFVKPFRTVKEQRNNKKTDFS